MTHFAVVAPAFTSHVRALEALAAALLDRGHRVSWIQQADVRSLLRDQRIEFHAVGARSHPPGSMQALVERAANPGGLRGLKRVIADVAAGTDMLCREAPAVLRQAGVQALIADQMEAAGGLLGEGLGLPFISVACALPVNREPKIPLPVMPWGYARDERGEHLNDGSTRVYDWLMRPHEVVIALHASAFGIAAPRRTLADCLSPIAQLSQASAGFDFPREAAPPHFHAVGPLRSNAADEKEAPLDLPGVDARPLVFASLGTLQGGRFGLFKKIARACKAADVQLLLAHCDQLDAAQAAALARAGATWVTGFAPQRAAIARADVVITHAGMNTVMDALQAGKPMLALPIAFDQPGVAARVAHAGVGIRLIPALASASALARALKRLLDEPQFRARAAVLGAEVQRAGGVERAADIVLSALQGDRTGAGAAVPAERAVAVAAAAAAAPVASADPASAFASACACAARADAAIVPFAPGAMLDRV